MPVDISFIWRLTDQNVSSEIQSLFFPLPLSPIGANVDVCDAFMGFTFVSQTASASVYLSSSLQIQRFT